MTTEPAAAEAGRDFIRDIVRPTSTSKKHSRIVTRFPPEPNGYLHIGHAKSIALNFGIAQEFSGRCHLRFDDTNPTKEEQEYIDFIQADVHWLGYDWGTDLYYASDYFDRLDDWAEGLIRAGHADVDDQSQEEIRVKRGTLTESPRCSMDLDRRAPLSGLRRSLRRQDRGKRRSSWAGIILRHEAVRDEPRPEISGHFHPKLRVHLRGRHVSRRCFVMSASKIIMPPSARSPAGWTRIIQKSWGQLAAKPRRLSQSPTGCSASRWRPSSFCSPAKAGVQPRQKSARSSPPPGLRRGTRPTEPQSPSRPSARAPVAPSPCAACRRSPPEARCARRAGRT